MAQPHARFPDNAPGAYYVDRTCIDCDKCRASAPAHFTRHDAGFSFVHTQPANPLEEAACLNALARCPVGAIGRDGLEPGPAPMRNPPWGTTTISGPRPPSSSASVNCWPGR